MLVCSSTSDGEQRTDKSWQKELIHIISTTIQWVNNPNDKFLVKLSDSTRAKLSPKASLKTHGNVDENSILMHRDGAPAP